MEAAVGFLLIIQIKNRRQTKALATCDKRYYYVHLKSLYNYYYEEGFQCCRLFIISLQNRYARGNIYYITTTSQEEVLIESFSGHSPSLFRLMNEYSEEKVLLYLLKNLEHNLLSEHFWGSE